MIAPSKAFLSWWRTQREATVAAGICRQKADHPAIDCPSCRRWMDLFSVSIGTLSAEDRPLAESYQAFIWAFRERFERALIGQAGIAVPEGL